MIRGPNELVLGRKYRVTFLASIGHATFIGEYKGQVNDVWVFDRAAVRGPWSIREGWMATEVEE